MGSHRSFKNIYGIDWYRRNIRIVSRSQENRIRVICSNMTLSNMVCNTECFDLLLNEMLFFDFQSRNWIMLKSVVNKTVQTLFFGFLIDCQNFLFIKVSVHEHFFLEIQLGRYCSYIGVSYQCTIFLFLNHKKHDLRLIYAKQIFWFKYILNLTSQNIQYWLMCKNIVPVL